MRRPTSFPLLQRTVLLLLGTACLSWAQFDTPPRGFGRGSVEAVVLSPDGGHLITSGSDGIYVYKAESLDDVAHLTLDPRPFHRDVGPVFSPDSRLLAMGYADTTVVVWDMESYTEAAILTGHEEWITALAFSDDSSLLATGDRTGRMKVWSVDDWSLTAQGRSELVRVLVFQGLERLVASNGFRAIRVWRLPDFVEEELLVHEDNVGILHVFSDERRLISGAADGTARLWDLNTGETLAILPQPGNATAGVYVSPDEQYVVLYNSSSSYAGTHVWRLDPLQEIAVFSYPDSGPLGISGDSRHLLMWSVREQTSTQIRFWDFASGEFVDSVAVNERGRAAFDAEALQLTMVTTTGRIVKHDLTTAEVSGRHVSYLQNVQDIAFSPGGEWLAAAFSSTVHIWDVATRQLLSVVNLDETSIDQIAFSADCNDLYIRHLNGLERRSLEAPSTVRTIYDGYIQTSDMQPAIERAALGWRQGEAAVIDLRRGTTVASFSGQPDGLSKIGLSPDASLMAVSGAWREDPVAWLWRVADGQLLGRLPARRAGVAVFDFSSDSRLMAASGWYDGVQLWDTESLTLVDSIDTISRSEGLAFSPDDRWPAWNEPGREPLRLMEIDSRRKVVAAAGDSYFNGEGLRFSPEGSMVAMGGSGGRVWAWDADEPSASLTSPCADIELRLPVIEQSPDTDGGSRDTVVTVPDDVAAPTSVALSLGQPNPVISGTTISFDVATRARVRLEVYNIQGQVTRVLVERRWIWAGTEAHGTAGMTVVAAWPVVSI